MPNSPPQLPEATTRCPHCRQELDDPENCAACGWQRPDPRPGMIISGKYRVDGLLAAGGMGGVYHGQHLQLGQPIAIKFLHMEYAQHPVVRGRFRREALALSQLRHPGIVSILDFGEHEQELYLVMELVAGRTLKSLVARKGIRVPLERLGKLFDQLLEVLEMAHAARIVHRDLKPENVMVIGSGDDERVKLLDFGLAKIEGKVDSLKLTSTGMVYGTPHFMSPEQCRAKPVGPPTDIYAVGVMLFEALAGALPFEADNAAGLMTQHLHVDPPRIAEVGDKREVPPGLERLVHRALAKKAPDRPSAAEFRTLLASAIRGSDPDSVNLRRAVERANLNGLTRNERAPALPEPVIREVAPTPRGEEARVVLWIPGGPRANALRDALAVHELSPLIWTGLELPPNRGEVRAVLVLADPFGAERTAAIRANAAFERTPVVVIEASSAAQTAQLIRAGAADVALGSSGVEEICKKVKRIVRRGSR